VPIHKMSRQIPPEMLEALKKSPYYKPGSQSLLIISRETQIKTRITWSVAKNFIAYSRIWRLQSCTAKIPSLRYYLLENQSKIPRVSSSYKTPPHVYDVVYGEVHRIFSDAETMAMAWDLERRYPSSKTIAANAPKTKRVIKMNKTIDRALDRMRKAIATLKRVVREFEKSACNCRGHRPRSWVSKA
jgi:hypothetical protein